mmetsp:Transcript_40168/g.106295  ORF Transcript_40168/g.106295 Transcript_40168/m.106295 type:complete len:135 (-) Transcript_40168:286-690(-)|eukprot:CAMPEP_0115859438 /NCGR_PEP_ID=MMETSP0287-20121206/16615_1 /TAXON_ID=412157 /ORGANISM="Chrysochromulina rotalis, Strain UIO044" /LENGTH=134 /DNA_ID=CAMNT_0003313737 /DNA_START=56 /DNA_END=460 /DNA_ORIENTATION=-
MNDLANRRFKETLDSEKRLRRQWAEHEKGKEIFDPSSREMEQLQGLCNQLSELCADPTRTGKSEVPEPPSTKKQLTKLRNEMRKTLANIDRKLETVDVETNKVDPVAVEARAKAMERMKLPKHLRGSAVLNETL